MLVGVDSLSPYGSISLEVVVIKMEGPVMGLVLKGESIILESQVTIADSFHK